MPQYTWITYLAAVEQLAARLADPGMVFWTKAELQTWLTEALRTWNALTEVWNADFAFNPTSDVWYDFSSLANSPRLRTLTDTNLYTAIEFSLLEPPTGGSWSGTSQFSITDLSGALQRRRDQMIQASGCNLVDIPSLSSSPNQRRTNFPDTVLEAIRARWVPASGSPNTMTREDSLAFDDFEPGHLQTPGTPLSWSVVAGPPLAMDVDVAPNQPGKFDVMTLQSGLAFNPPSNTLLGVPDDWAWVLKFGALSDLMGRDSEATDRQRSQYCLKRFEMGLEVMRQSNWLVSATIKNVPVDTPSLKEMDAFSPEWQNDPNAWKGLVTAGIDLAAPVPVGSSSVSVVLVGNAPVPALDTDFVQVSRDTFDAILDYAQVLASFKMGGAEFMSTQPLEKNFFAQAAATNKRLMKSALFLDMIRSEGKRQQITQPR